MGIRSMLGFMPKIDAQFAPPIMGENFGTNFNGFFGQDYASPILRNEAMQVPAMARARNLICGVIATIPMELFDAKTGSKLDIQPPWVNQPDYRQPRSSTIAWTVDSLLFHPVAYWEVVQEYSDGRPADMAWVSNDRVSVITKSNNTVVDYYLVDGIKRPWSGLTSLITFQSIAGDGILATGGQTLRSALDIQNAATVAAQTPQATGHLKNSGADIPEAAVEALKSRWKANRKANAVSYLTSTIDFVPNSFAPKDMMYNEAIQYLSTQIARLCNISGYLLDAEVFRSTTYQNVIDERKNFVDFTLRPFIASIEDRLSMDDICPRGQVVRFAIDETFLRNDPLTRLSVIEKMLQLGLIDLPEAKEMEGLADSGSESAPLASVTPMKTPLETPVKTAMETQTMAMGED